MLTFIAFYVLKINLEIERIFFSSKNLSTQRKFKYKLKKKNRFWPAKLADNSTLDIIIFLTNFPLRGLFHLKNSKIAIRLLNFIKS